MSTVDVIALPRDPNPYQELLYAPMRAQGARVRYAGRLTPSHTLNLLLLPLELAVWRLRGFRILHLHWTFGFRPAAAGDRAGLRRACRTWFGIIMAVTRRLGLRLVWTVHNVLPHEPVFDDDLAARRTLLATADLVIAHSPATLAELAGLALRPRASTVIAQGPNAPRTVAELPPPSGAGRRTALFFGRIEPYKGVEELLDVAAERGTVHVRVIGRCGSAELRERLVLAAQRAGDAVELQLGHVPDAELPELMRAADVLVFPFRRVTTSSSVLLGMASARPVVVPDLPAFDEIPEEAVFRYPHGTEGLRQALRAVAATAPADLRQKGLAARAFATSRNWEEIAALTQEAFRSCVGDRRQRSPTIDRIPTP